MDHSTMKWLLNPKIEKDKRAGFVNPRVWIEVINKIGEESFEDELERMECVVFVLGVFCGEKAAAFGPHYLLELNRLAGKNTIFNFNVDEGMYLAFDELANAAAIKLYERMTSCRQMANSFPPSPMGVFLEGLRDRLGASSRPLPVGIR